MTTNITGTGSLTSLGIGSGLDVNALISKLMEARNKPVVLLQTQEAGLQATLSAFGGLKSALSQFQTALQNITNVESFQSLSASVANSSVATATATSSAVSGTYSLQVKQLAQTQTLVATGQASATSPIGVGTISFNFGTTSGTVTNGLYQAGTTFTGSGAAAKTVTIDTSNNSLTGIAAAINAANIGVTASVLNDGSNTPYRLSLSSTNTGAANSMQISVTGDAALASLLNQDPTSTTGQKLIQTSAAQNAEFTLNGLAISGDKNTNSAVIPGVTLNLLSTNLSSPTTLSISQSHSGAVSAINSFVSAYNTIASAISTSTGYDSTAKKAGPLQGQNSVLSIMNDMQQILNSPVPGAPNNLSMLAQIGIKFNNDGVMSVDNAKLESAMAANPTGVIGLFASTGAATDSLIQYQGSTSATAPGAYRVNITQLASQGNTIGSAVANTTITAGVNDSLQVNLNGVTATVVLAAGNYTSASLAIALQTAINTNSSFSAADNAVSVTQNGGILSVTSSLYGSASIASITGGNGLTDFFGSAAIATTGVDVAGTIGGQAAIGKGQKLTGSEGGATGLSILVSGSNLGARGIINYTQGYADELDNLMSTVLGSSGPIASVTDGINASIKDIQSSVTTRLALNQQVLASFQAEFSALDVLMSNLTHTSSMLTQQLSSLRAQSNSD